MRRLLSARPRPSRLLILSLRRGRPVDLRSVLLGLGPVRCVQLEIVVLSFSDLPVNTQFLRLVDKCLCGRHVARLLRRLHRLDVPIYFALGRLTEN